MEHDVEPPKLLSRMEAAKFLGVNYGTLVNWRERGIGPAYVVFGTKHKPLYKYRLEDLQAYIDDNVVEPTAPAA